MEAGLSERLSLSWSPGSSELSILAAPVAKLVPIPAQQIVRVYHKFPDFFACPNDTVHDEKAVNLHHVSYWEPF